MLEALEAVNSMGKSSSMSASYHCAVHVGKGIFAMAKFIFIPQRRFTSNSNQVRGKEDGWQATCPDCDTVKWASFLLDTLWTCRDMSEWESRGREGGDPRVRVCVCTNGAGRQAGLGAWQRTDRPWCRQCERNTLIFLPASERFCGFLLKSARNDLNVSDL